MRYSVLLVILSAILPIQVAAAPQGTDGYKKLAILESQVRRIRQLSQIHPVRAEFLPDRQFEEIYDAAARRGSPVTETQLSQQELVELGMLSRGQNLWHILFQDLGAQVGGFYDDRRKILFVRNHANDALGVRRDLIAHEYTHALQDQHYNLQRLTPDQFRLTYRNSDAPLAHKALIEGDAVNTQTLFISRTYTPRELQRFMTIQNEPVKAPKLPPSIQRLFDFPYTTGLAFVQELFARGGMRAVDAAYHRLPSSTYEIMHPSAYLAGWKPVSVRLHAVHAFGGWKRADDDVFGALGYDLWLRQFLPESTAGRAVDGYKGDRYIFLRRAGQWAMMLRSVWEDTAATRAANAAIVRVLVDRFGATGARREVGGFAVIGRGGAGFTSLKGDTLTVSLAPTATIARLLATGSTS